MAYLKDFAPGTFLVMREGMDNEVRESYYIRREGEGRHKNFVKIARLGTIQGDPESDEPPRYIRLCDEPCIDPGEAHGLATMEPIESNIFLSRIAGPLPPWASRSDLRHDPPGKVLTARFIA